MSVLISVSVAELLVDILKGIGSHVLLSLSKPNQITKTMTKKTQILSTELNKLNDETQNLSGYWCLLRPNCFVPMGPCIDSGFVASKSSFSLAALVSEPKWLKQGREFITSGQCNYLGSGHVTEINMTQSIQPLTLIHDKVRQCLSIERSGLLDFVRVLLFWFTVGSLQHYKRAIVLQERSNEWTAEVAPMEKAKSEQLPLLAHLDTTHSQLGWQRREVISTALT